MSEQLKPCPFCGSCNIGSSYIETYSVDSSYDVFGRKDCGARFEDGDADEWNTRTDDAALAAKDVRIAASEICSDRAYRNGLIAGFAYGINGDETGYHRSLTAYQAGIHEAVATQQKTDCPKEECPVTGAVRDVDPADLVATPSEDGPEEMQFAYLHPNGERHTVTVSREEVLREMPDFLFEKLCGNFCQCEPVGETNVVECNCDEYAEEFQLLAAEPNAVTKEVAELRAQHSRIVAAKDAAHRVTLDELHALEVTVAKAGQELDAKDAEIARLCKLAYIGEHQFEDCTYKFRLEELRAQPARQVGGDDVYSLADKIRTDLDRQACPNSWMVIAYEACVKHASAALAPAAVAVVPDEVRVNLDSLWADAAYLCARLEQDSMPADDVVKVIRDRIDAAKAALSLNRRAIPLELLERVCSPRNEATGWAASADAISELRALLGKDTIAPETKKGDS